MYAYRTYVIGAYVKKDSLPKALWWDTGNFESNPELPPYHYVRWHPYNDQFDLLICGGEDHLTGNTEDTDVAEADRYALLEKWAREHFQIGDIAYRWSGQVSEPMDGVAFIGRNPRDKENVYIVTGDSGNGMTHCTIDGILITDLITGKENLKCTIAWNKDEKTWDCPCHGSRFTIDGEVINGPANRDLAAYSESKNTLQKNLIFKLKN